MGNWGLKINGFSHNNGKNKRNQKGKEDSEMRHFAVHSKRFNLKIKNKIFSLDISVNLMWDNDSY